MQNRPPLALYPVMSKQLVTHSKYYPTETNQIQIKANISTHRVVYIEAVTGSFYKYYFLNKVKKCESKGKYLIFYNLRRGWQQRQLSIVGHHIIV